MCPDLRGYGQSSKPPSTEDHQPYSKRVLARDCVRLMTQLGHKRFAVVGHDRGSYVAMRAALDFPERVSALAVLDSVPIGDALRLADARFAQRWWHWFFFAQPDLPERLILSDPTAFYRGSEEAMGARNFEDFRRATSDPETVRGMLEDYRAGLGVDRAADDADRASGRRLPCPTLVAWSRFDDMYELYGQPSTIWRDWADDLRTATVDSGHHMAEEAPVELSDHIVALLRDAHWTT